MFWVGLYLVIQPELVLDWPLGNPWGLVIPALVYPVLEEIVFRGGLQTAFHKVFQSPPLGPVSLANLGTSIVFTVVHFVYHAPLWAVSIFIPSLIFGYLKDRYHSLRSPIAVHIFYNLGYYWLFSPAPSY